MCGKAHCDHVSARSAGWKVRPFPPLPAQGAACSWGDGGEGESKAARDSFHSPLRSVQSKGFCLQCTLKPGAPCTRDAPQTLSQQAETHPVGTWGSPSAPLAFSLATGALGCQGALGSGFSPWLAPAMLLLCAVRTGGTFSWKEARRSFGATVSANCVAVGVGGFAPQKCKFLRSMDLPKGGIRASSVSWPSMV